MRFRKHPLQPPPQRLVFRQITNRLQRGLEVAEVETIPIPTGYTDDDDREPTDHEVADTLLVEK